MFFPHIRPVVIQHTRTLERHTQVGKTEPLPPSDPSQSMRMCLNGSLWSRRPSIAWRFMVVSTEWESFQRPVHRHTENSVLFWRYYWTQWINILLSALQWLAVTQAMKQVMLIIQTQ